MEPRKSKSELDVFHQRYGCKVNIRIRVSFDKKTQRYQLIYYSYYTIIERFYRWVTYCLLLETHE